MISRREFAKEIVKERNLIEINELINNLIKNQKINGCDKKLIYFLLAELINAYTLKDEIITMFEEILNSTAFTSYEYLAFLNLIVSGYLKSEFHWRGRKYAIEAKELLDKKEYINTGINKRKCYEKIYENMGDFFFNVYDFKTSLECYQSSEKWHGKPVTDYFLKQVKCHLYLDKDYICPFSKEELKNRYKRYYESLEDLLEFGLSFKIDPVVNTKEFQDIYDDVMEETYKIMEERDMNIHIPQLLWMVMGECFAKRGISWKSPQRMNPRIRFD